MPLLKQPTQELQERDLPLLQTKFENWQKLLQNKLTLPVPILNPFKAKLMVLQTQQLPLINPQGLGMARVLQVEKMLSLFASKYPSVEWSLRVEGDEAIPENNDFYTVSNGKCVRGYLRNQVYHPCTINQLTRLLFAKETPYMSLMIN